MSPKKEKQLKDSYEKFILTALGSSSDVGFEDITSHDIMGYGTAIDEKILSREEAIHLIHLQRKQSIGYEVNYVPTPIFTRISDNEDNALIVEEIKLTLSSEDLEHILFIRITTVMEYIDNKWKVVHWHGSIPQESTSEDTWHINEWIRKAEELQELVDEKTADLALRNRELEIEASLEKVRSVSVAMYNSDELQKVILVLFEQLKHLGIICDVSFIQVFDESKDSNIWVANPQHDYAQLVTIPYHKNPILDRLFTARKKGESFFTDQHSKGVKNNFYRHAFKRSALKNIPKPLQQEVLNRKGYARSVALNKYAAIIIFNLDGKPYSDHENNILKRFGKVFEQTYSRFLDLMKAEAQAREAQVEAALERVRSRTLGMHRSDELQDAAMVLFQQIEALGVPVFGCGFNIWDNDRKSATAWMAGKDRFQPSFKTSSSEDIFLRIYQAAERGESLFVEEQAGKALEAHYQHMASIPVFKDILEKLEKNGQSVPSYQIMHCAFFPQGYLMFISFEEVSYAHDTFNRFAKVFEQTYTRFLDLQKAEAQAREAQIEVALEKVRSRSMAMHTTQEFSEVAVILFKQLKKLGVDLQWCWFAIVNNKEKIYRYMVY